MSDMVMKIIANDERAAIEMSISYDDLMFLFDTSPNNENAYGDSAVKIKDTSLFMKEFVDILKHYEDSDDGCPIWGHMIEKVFLEMMENGLDCLEYTEDDEFDDDI